MEVIVFIDYPLSMYRQIKIPSHVTDGRLSEVIERKIRQSVMGLPQEEELSVAYSKVKDSPGFSVFEVFVVKGKIMKELIESLGEYRRRVSLITSANLAEAPEANDKSMGNDESIDMSCCLSRHMRRFWRFNHVDKATREDVPKRRSAVILARLTVLWLGVMAIIFLCSSGIGWMFSYSNRKLVEKLSNSKRSISMYMNLLGKRDSLVREVEKYSHVSRLRSSNSWIIYQLEKTLPASIYLSKIMIESKDSTGSRVEMSGVVEEEKDLFRTMEELGNMEFIRDLELKRLTKKGQGQSQFELEMYIE